ncbi:peptidyl-prolyl cis-trans isomerase [Metabacillus arenae]|uniref:peptidylprolyl isomerase n=1 Tax=Metabacillus arenae TaxID=2771434 RepID=A0A926RZJ3_9BACI|nr:peptidyl-prolyl cis-trans isomerase [Metabacillus arenae]MBD1383191.1 peptidyl-prolyl cis-trans isomerase [Metabacillus arenae]
MNGKTLWMIIFGLVIINCFTVGYFVTKGGFVSAGAGSGHGGEEIASIGSEKITRSEWLAELENRYGKETLEEMINTKVVEELAAKHKISVSDKVIDRELKMFKAMYNSFDNQKFENEEKWRDQIRYSILLEELLTRDVVVQEEEVRKFYENNQELYQIEDTYHLSHIAVKSEEEAKNVLKELAGGSSFEAIAAERSIDEFSASEGGDLGFVSAADEYLPSEYIEHAKILEENMWSKDPIKTDAGYAILLVQEKIKGKQFGFDEVKQQIKRQIALEQMEGNVSVKPLWEEVEVEWFYGTKKNETK